MTLNAGSDYREYSDLTQRRGNRALEPSRLGLSAQVRCAFGHAPPDAARTDGAPLTRERHEPVEAASLAPEPRETASEGPAGEITPELLLDESRQAAPLVSAGCLGAESLEVIAHHLVQLALRGSLRLVLRG